MRTLVVGAHMSPEGLDKIRLVDDFQKSCPNLTSLKVISTEISLNLPLAFNNLRELSVNPYPKFILSPDIWQRIGCSLQKLAIYDDIPKVNEVFAIQEHSQKLKSIVLLGDEDDYIAAIANLLTSHGDQLEYAEISYLNESLYTLVSKEIKLKKFLFS